jgi:hypothetical protein
MDRFSIWSVSSIRQEEEGKEVLLALSCWVSHDLGLEFWLFELEEWERSHAGIVWRMLITARRTKVFLKRRFFRELCFVAAVCQHQGQWVLVGRVWKCRLIRFRALLFFFDDRALINAFGWVLVEIFLGGVLGEKMRFEALWCCENVVQLHPPGHSSIYYWSHY